MGLTRRPLSAVEAPYLVSNVIIGVTADLQGTVDRTVLRAALAALFTEYPVLMGRIEYTETGADLVVEDLNSEAESAVALIEEETWREDSPFTLDPTKRVSQVKIASAGDVSRLSLGIFHGIFDGMASAFIAVRLMWLYVNLLSGKDVEILPSQPTPKSPEQVLKERSVPIGPTGEDRLSGVVWNGVLPLAEALPEGACIWRPSWLLNLPLDISTDLRELAKAEDISLHSLICGAVLVAERSVHAGADSADQLLPFGLFSPVDMRNRISPPLSPVEVTNFAGVSRVKVQVSANSDIVEIGRLVQEQLRSDIKNGTVLSTLADPAESTGEEMKPSVATMVSNVGVVALPELLESLAPPNAQWLDIQLITQMDYSQLKHVIPSLPEGAVLPPAMGTYYHVYTVGEKLTISLRIVPGSHSPDLLAQIRSSISDLLIAAARRKHVNN
ncbi:hypothetical protein Srot_2531 [Segniliparus rotundus DSM 44985]|uniref:Phthiocerol/phthiodiolone dimycocerosyl transferase n=1 Tax=Segniliparus rotundus (strain ATCC BAA-972 / CDC 1076 / CIP 108378 / DSM 44985 / JCM 13578) TaxID=640132 RepID=D6ZBL6_SEGRD|nr:hypothetical protein [Segniliparus rotundus]ADG98968.1 hypothetical protein Srot_2531 [Segniliparus rotundus DSM 44985]